ncbi:MAG TPA: YicC/YloC family endoribonuclease [Chlamydiales bacterium]|nr:YicC/YloC family endoribonuclease [Chlamydiales bacterium]
MEHQLRSMTGFGRGESSFPLGKLVLEITAINRKYLDLSVQLPKEMVSFEPEIRNLVQKKIHRGQLILRYTFYPKSTALSLLPDTDLLKDLKSEWEKRAKALGYKKESIDIHFLATQLQRNSNSVEWVETKSFEEPLTEVTEKAIEALFKMKVREAKILKEDILKRLQSLEKAIDLIEKRAPLAAVKLKEKLNQKIEELVPTLADNEERVLREVMMYSEKMDITEEIVRFRSHLKQFFSLLKKPEETAGRKMDFLIQELMREINTMGAKAADTEITSSVVNVKTELEKVREQVQNIE